ncbi:4-hydroxybenzoate synthetase [Gracilibacillus salinarum]|uniref:4-hydroxybenzoate synthetase n=1 Tax=Gracilibacillus salinarum TaxID=2932255 RepID=A0ABY4GHD8_9BACI|nr:4-hydroxybenzoate synthetase [Gracilibacillus salinarum]UOQ83659.1 4-hydroxybenzoate synthetase [Gracilibacillus salinarum]
MIDSPFDKEACQLLQGLLLDLLLVTDGRTTDLLEVLVNEKIVVEVIQQEKVKETYYIRESVLIGEKSGFIVSHNIALVHAEHVPAELFESMANRQEGIGKAMNSLGLRSFRKVEDGGFLNKADARDVFQKPVSLRFRDTEDKVPYKRYNMYFGSEPGIEMIEYYHPNLIEHRLEQEINKEKLND